MTENKKWSKSSKNDLLVNKQSPKNDNTTTFFIKQKMLGIYGFHNKFSNLGPSDLIECVPDGPEPHAHEIGLGAPWEGSK